MPRPPAHAASPPPVEEFHALGTPDAIERYRSGVLRLDKCLLELDDGTLDTFFRPEAGVGRWSCRALVGHLADAEIVFAHRLRRAVAEDNPIVSAWDADAFIDAGLYADDRRAVRHPIAGFVAVIHTTRKWMSEWLDALDEPAWQRRMLHERRGEFTVRAMLDFCVWHLEHHVWYLDRKLAYLGASPDAPAGGDSPGAR